MSFSSLLSYVFYPNPGNASYSSPTQLVLLIVSLALIGGYFGLSYWRKQNTNPIAKKLSKPWPAASLWFGIIGVVLVVSRVEGIQFLAMRFTWALWLGALAAFVMLQAKLWRTRHYQVLPSMKVSDPRDRYLPGKKAKR